MRKKIVFLPYDMDTAIGINNEGALVFSYNLEDIDQTAGGADVFNGQQSVLWKNMRAAFFDEMKAMYQNLRSTGALSYDKVEQMFEEHQGKWPEAIFNEDAWFKYLAPLVEKGNASYLSMLQGSKAEQRKWWLYNRFRYIDSKYNAGDSLSDVITVRGYAKANITVEPYADVYASVKYGSYLVQARSARNTQTTLVCPLDNVNDTEIYIYSASQLASVGDLSGLMVGYADFSKAVKLQALKIGDASETYSNGNLTELYLGNNELLRTIDVRNCPNLTQAVDISGCSNIEEVYFGGTGITGCSLPNGGVLKVLQLPGTITNLTVRNQPSLTTFEMPTYANISTLRIENTGSAINVHSILQQIAANSRVRIIGLQLTMTTTAQVEDFFDLLDTMRGLDESGNNVDAAQVQGTITGLGNVTGAWLASVNARYPDITIEYEHIASSLRYYSYDGAELLYTEEVLDGADGGEYTGQPTRAATKENKYTFAGWSRSMNQTKADSDALKNVTADRNVYAAYTVQKQVYTVYFYNGSTLLQTVPNVPYGGTATYTGSTPTYTGSNPEDYEFNGWSPLPSNITGNTSCYAAYRYTGLTETITDSWAEIIDAVNNGTYSTKYSVGDTKILDLGSEGNVCMQIAAFNADDKASGGKAAISWISEQLLTTSHRMNPKLVTNFKYGSGPSFKRNSTSEKISGYHQWDAQNKYTANNTAKITFTVTAVKTGTLRLEYMAGATSTNTTSLKINGTEVIITHNANTQNYDLAITSGTTYVIEFETTRRSNTDITNTHIKLCNTSNSGTDANVTALVTIDSIVIGDCIVRSFDGYAIGTGSVGGWTDSEMRTWLRETVAPQIPAVVSAATVEVTKTQNAYGTSGSMFTQTTTDTVWIPSFDEIAGTSSLYYGLFKNTNANRKKNKSGGTYASAWWTRSAQNYDRFYCMNTSGSSNDIPADNSNSVALGFCM